MKYSKFGNWFIADPKTWEELRYTIHHEPEVFLSYDPSAPVEVSEADIEAMNQWLQ